MMTKEATERRSHEATRGEWIMRNRQRSIGIRQSTLRLAFALCYSTFAILWCAVPTLQAQSGGGYVITESTIASGGDSNLTGGGYKLSCTVGQHDAGDLAGGGFNITGGFWFETPLGDCDFDGVVGRGDIRSFVHCADGPGSPLAPAECVCSDFDGDGDIDLRDFAGLQVQFAGQ